MTLAQRSGAHTPARAAACQALLQRLRGAAGATGEAGIDTVRIAWADLHGTQRAKTLVLDADAANVAAALQDGIGMVSTMLLKDTADRTAFKVFEPGALAALPGFAAANNTLLLPDPGSFVTLPWAPRTGWLRAQAYWPDGSPVALDPRPVLQHALAALAAHEGDGGPGLGLRCGLEVEFHIYRITSEAAAPNDAAWPGEAPEVALLHPGYGLLSEAHADQAHEALDLVRHTALGLGLPLQSLEIELGPSQFEAVLAPTDALTAADHMMLLRNGLRQALRRAGYHVSFVCRPPFANAVASGWHLHHSLVDARGKPVMSRHAAAAGAAPRRTRSTGAKALAAGDAARLLSPTGAHWLGGLLAHAAGMCALCAPTLPAYSRYRGSVMAPQAPVWGYDNRGAMLRVLGQAGASGATSVRIENRLPEPMANPYLVLAAHVWAGLDGLRRRLDPGPAAEDPYASQNDSGQQRLPTTLPAALQALAADATLQAGLGAHLLAAYQAIKQQEITRHAQTDDAITWERREYFARY
jgi:glutamine synthetase